MNIEWESLQDKVTATLQDLIRFNTTNPPGNETRVAEYVRGRLAAQGIESTVVESAPGRGSVIGRLHGDGSRPPLLLMGHSDVVTAEASQWAHPPFAGDLVDGVVWGRGAVDMKGLIAVELEVMLLLKQLGTRLKRDLILAVTADEEAGATQGMRWLLDYHADLLDAEYALNEGGGIGHPVGGRWLFGCQTAEKGIAWLRLRARGEPGHASTPRGAMAVGKLAAAVERLAGARLPQHPARTVRDYIETLSRVTPGPAGSRLLGLLDPTLEVETLAQMPDRNMAAVLNAALRNTAVPTVLRAGEKINVIPSVAEAEVDCRLAPGQTADDVIREVRALVGDDVEIEVGRYEPGIESGADTPLFDTIRAVMSELESASVAVPWMAVGATDGRFLAQRGVKVYGFWPLKAQPGEPVPSSLFHAHNERVSVANLRFAVAAFGEVVRRFAAE
jgi:acetylornithine deacetylase/succinyl-diaminopimelate desuccinylase-like protein